MMEDLVLLLVYVPLHAAMCLVFWGVGWVISCGFVSGQTCWAWGLFVSGLRPDFLWSDFGSNAAVLYPKWNRTRRVYMRRDKVSRFDFGGIIITEGGRTEVQPALICKAYAV